MTKKNRLILLLSVLFLLGSKSVFAANAQTKTPAPATTTAGAPSPIQPQLVDFSQCNRYFKVDSQKLFYLSLASINANRFTIDEIQSKSGYILFSVLKRQYLASVIAIDSKNSLLKITPTNNNYYFPVGIVQNFFKYIELNLNTPIEKLGVTP